MRYLLHTPNPTFRTPPPARQTAEELSSALARGVGEKYSHLFEDEQVRGFELAPADAAERRRAIRGILCVYAALVGSALGLAALTTFLGA